jgi:hypothetical protein
MLEKRLGCRLTAIQPGQIIGLRKIWASIHDGMSEPKTWFDMLGNSPDQPQAKEQTAPPPNAPPTEQETPAPQTEAGRKAASKKKADVPEQSPVQEPDAPQKPEESPAASSETIACADKEWKKVPITNCDGCASRNDCPSWDGRS